MDVETSIVTFRGVEGFYGFSESPGEEHTKHQLLDSQSRISDSMESVDGLPKVYLQYPSSLSVLKKGLKKR